MDAGRGGVRPIVRLTWSALAKNSPLSTRSTLTPVTSLLRVPLDVGELASPPGTLPEHGDRGREAR